MESTPQILIASSELENRRVLNEVLHKEGYETICTSRVSECQEALQTQNVSLIFCDRRLSDGSYRDVIAAIRASRHHARIVVTSRLADWDEDIRPDSRSIRKDRNRTVARSRLASSPPFPTTVISLLSNCLRWNVPRFADSLPPWPAKCIPY